MKITSGQLAWDHVGPWRARDLGDGGVLLGFQVRLLLKTNFVTQPRLAAVVHNARVYYEMLLHFIDDWRPKAGMRN